MTGSHASFGFCVSLSSPVRWYARTWFLPTTIDAVVDHAADVQVVGVARHPPQHLAGAQVEALQLVGVVGGRGSTRPLADDRPGRRASGRWAVAAGGSAGRYSGRTAGSRPCAVGSMLAVGVRPQQAAGHDVHRDDDAGVRRADDDAVAGGEGRALVAADRVLRERVVRLAELLAPDERRLLLRLAGHLHEVLRVEAQQPDARRPARSARTACR